MCILIVKVKKNKNKKSSILLHPPSFGPTTFVTNKLVHIINPSNFVVYIQLREVSGLDLVGPDEDSILFAAVELLHALARTVVLAKGLVQLDAHLVPLAQLRHFAHKLDAAAAAGLSQLTALVDLNFVGGLLHEIRVNHGLARALSCNLGVSIHKLLLPLAEAVRKFALVLLLDLLLFHLADVLQFLQNRVWVQVHNVDVLAVLGTEVAQHLLVVVQVADIVSLLILQNQLHHRGVRAVALFDVVLHRKDVLVEVEAHLRELERGNAVRKVQLHRRRHDAGVRCHCRNI